MNEHLVAPSPYFMGTMLKFEFKIRKNSESEVKDIHVYTTPTGWDFQELLRFFDVMCLQSVRIKLVHSTVTKDD